MIVPLREKTKMVIDRTNDFQDNADGLLIAKICHDLKNCLSIVTFIKEDLNDGTVDLKTGLADLIKSVDNLNLRLSFFQNLAVDGSHIGNLYEMLTEMCSDHNVQIIYEMSTANSIGFEQNIICGILYLIVIEILRGNNSQKITVSKDLHSGNVIILLPNMMVTSLPTEVIDLTEMDDTEVTVVNALALYIKRLMKRHGWRANVYDVKEGLCQEESGVKIVLAKLN